MLTDYLVKIQKKLENDYKNDDDILDNDNNIVENVNNIIGNNGNIENNDNDCKNDSYKKFYFKGRRTFMQSIELVMMLYEKYAEEHCGFTNRIGKYVSGIMNITSSHVYVLRYHGIMLKKHKLYDQALAEDWTMKQVRKVMIFIKEMETRKKADKKKDD